MKKGGGWVVVQIILMASYFFLPWGHPRASFAPFVLGVSLLAVGVLLFLAGIARLGRSLTPFPVPRRNAQLATSGAFGLVRHPIYSGLILAAAGWAIAMADLPRLGFAAVLFLFFDAKARLEEKLLREKFPEYSSYVQRVKRLIPGVY
jgi:protein-S-isoprenylcysteine O-methyltransferase Ste14